MTRFNKVLAGLFAAQLVLALGIYFGSQPPAVKSVQTTLLATDRSKVNHITIEEGEGKQTRLVKVDGKWKLPDYHQLTADQNKVEQILNNLSSTKSGWPVATTTSSQERFEVSDDKYQKRITLAEGDNKLQQFYLGTSPGFRQVHLRKAGEDKVYAVRLNSHEFPVSASDWLDRTQARPEGEITAVEGAGFNLVKQGDKWQPSAANGEPVQEELEKLVTAIKSFNVLEAVDKTIDKASYSLVVKTPKESINFHLLKEDDIHYLTRDGFNHAFKISQFDYDKIAGQTADKLVKSVVPESEGLTAGSSADSTHKDDS